MREKAGLFLHTSLSVFCSFNFHINTAYRFCGFIDTKYSMIYRE